MESITVTKFHRLSNFRVLVNKVQEELSGKKYLLVLDDLWNEDSEQWESLKSVLLIGAPGSKILITTRNNQVASIVGGSIPPYNLNQLQDDACWSIIMRKAFSPGGALNAPKMSNIGKEIAKKCCGLPLAAKFLGSLLHLKNKESDWISIRDDDIWNSQESKRKILAVLKLSYNYLPSHLKQCFSYCSIFPKNWEISKETLVHLWMAEGFLKQSDVRNKRSIEDFGRDSFESLAWSSFFHNFQKNELGDIETCKMHDLVHDLAEDVLEENELVSLKVSDFTNVSEEVRRLQLNLDGDVSETLLNNLSNAKKLRTLFIPEGSKLDPSVFSENNHLRIFHVGRAPNHARPKWHSLNVLKHLRYLRLTSLNLREVESDQSINKLYNLETLVLNQMGIRVQILLSNIQSSKKLRYLEVSRTDMVVLPDSVTSLCNLQTLDLNNCELKVIPDSISGLKKLRFLNLSFNPFEELPVSVITLSNLQTLDVNTCKNLNALPEYVEGLANLRIFSFKNCPLLNGLPKDIGALTQLRSLDLYGTGIKELPESCLKLSNLEYVGLFKCELPKDIESWAKLRKFHYYPRRNSIIFGVGKVVCLQELCYSVPTKQLVVNEPADQCTVGIEELGNLNFLEFLDISDLQNVKDPTNVETANLKGKQNLRRLSLHWGALGGMRWDEKSCNFQVSEALHPPTSLRELSIYNFMGQNLPTWMCVPSRLPNLVMLKLHNCTGIAQLPSAIGQLPRLSSLYLTRMSLKSLDIGGFPSLNWLYLTDMFILEELCYLYPPICLQDLRITGCKSLSEIPSFPSLTILVLKNIDHKLVCSVGRSQTSLKTLYLSDIDGLVYFPISILQSNCNLNTLQINKCNQFQGFRLINDENETVVPPDDRELYGAPFQELEFMDCPVLKFIPDLRGWTFLKYLLIFNCPQVKESLSYDLKSLSSLKSLAVDFIQRDDRRGDPSTYKDLINLLALPF